MKTVRNLAVALLLFLVCSSPVFAHGGHTDAAGGHTEKATGEYHFHHGYPAHSHKNGTCPYDFDDKSGGSSVYVFSVKGDEGPKPVPEEKKTYNWFLLCLPAVALAVFAGVSRIRRLQKNRFTPSLKKLREMPVMHFSFSQSWLDPYLLSSMKEDIYNFRKRFSKLTDKAVSIQYIHPDRISDQRGKRARRRPGYDRILDPLELYVYKAEHGKCFHRADCPAAYGKTPIRISEIVDLKPCSRCNAQTLLPSWYSDYIRLKNK